MTHPIFRKEFFVGTPFEIRFQAMLRSAWQKRNWHLIVADPGSGKTMGIRELVRTVGSPTILAVVAPKNNDDESALGNQLWSALGLKLAGHWSNRKPKLMGYLHQYGTQCLIVDDAHDLELAHLLFIKELTDQGRLQYDHPLGLCLVAAGRGDTIPLKETLYQPDPTWLQFRRRLDKMEPFCKIPGHTSEEVREILAALERVYREALPQLNLRRWSSSIYTWLTQLALDPTNSGRVTMDNLMTLVSAALEWSYEAKAKDVLAEMLEKAASLLVLHRDTLKLIDGAGPSTEASQPPSTEQGQESKTEPETKPERETAQADHDPHNTETVGTEEDQGQPVKTPKCTFPGVVSIELKRFLDSGTQLVECAHCGRTRTLSPSKGVLRFPSHNRRKVQTPVTGLRWAKGKTDWDVVGG
jgi:AAA domain